MDQSLPDIGGEDISLTSERAKTWITPQSTSPEQATPGDDGFAPEGLQLINGCYTPDEVAAFRNKGCLVVREAWGYMVYAPEPQ